MFKAFREYYTQERRNIANDLIYNIDKTHADYDQPIRETLSEENLSNTLEKSRDDEIKSHKEYAEYRTRLLDECASDIIEIEKRRANFLASQNNYELFSSQCGDIIEKIGVEDPRVEFKASGAWIRMSRR